MTTSFDTLLERLAAASKAEQPAIVGDIASGLASRTTSDAANEQLQKDKQTFLRQCEALLGPSTEILSQQGKKAAVEEDSDHDGDKEGQETLNLQTAILKALLRIILQDAKTTDMLLLEGDLYPTVLKLASAYAPEVSTSKSKSEQQAAAQEKDSNATTSHQKNNNLKPLVVIVLAKAFELTTNKVKVQDRSATIVLEDVGSDKIKIRAAGFQSLSTITQADLKIGCAMLNKEGLLAEIMDCIELEPEQIQVILAETLSAACADAKTRSTIGLHCSDFLKSIVHQGSTKNQHLKGAAAVALTKISLAEAQQDPSVGTAGLGGGAAAGGGAAGATGLGGAGNEEELARLFSKLLKDDKNDSTEGVQLNAVEGLAYASIQPKVKEMIATDKLLMLSLFRLAEQTKSSPLKYGLITIFNNITAFKKRLSAEQEQMQKLKKMAGAMPQQGSGGTKKSLLEEDDSENPLEAEAAVTKRNVALAKLGMMPAIHALVQQGSETIRQAVAQTIRNLVTPQETRGLLVQQGVVRILIPLSQKSNVEATKSAATQALAKISITLDPRLTFKNQRLVELVKPFIWLLDSTDQLCQFESLMALTNLGSTGDVAVLSLIVTENGIEKMENLQFSEHALVRRAATEALCNMIFFEPVFEAYSDPKRAKNKIHLLLALCDVEDFMTKRAASGALAVLSTSEAVCEMILAQERGLEILQGLITLGIVPRETEQEEGGEDSKKKKKPSTPSSKVDPETQAIEEVLGDQETVIDHEAAVARMDELRHRGAECIKNMVKIGGKAMCQQIAQRGGAHQLAALAQKSTNEAVRYCAMEALLAMRDQGVQIQ
ncbi:hypothetical protein DFQ27_005946 [Actinomortierella ambigua]|uniref:UNC-45/Cro1/She4 central domain-containing protein n=1 Tax=Actinomortierella ambigua TaxID=1343610 RepID=A0A9P6QJI2_9FUNG|nr:hypothetical protein DFQ27_005946 [Actinomortierella ambigua]